MKFSGILIGAGVTVLAAIGLAQQTPATGPYKIVKSVKVGGAGGFDYVYADADGGKLYIPRSAGRGGAGGAPRVDVYDLESLKLVGSIADANGVHGAAVDPKSHHGFCSSNPVVMWDTETLKTLKTIPVEGNPDGILFDPATEHVFVLSHSDPNVTVINAADGAIVGTIDLGGGPEQGASDGQGHVYIDIEDGNNVAAVDAKTLKVTAHYDLGGSDKGPGGLAMDAKNHILFAFCHDPATAVILNANDGKIITTLPIGAGVDAAEFNPNTMEAFSSQGDGTLTVIKENSPTDFSVEQTVKTPTGAKCSTLDSKTNQIYLTSAETAPPATQPAGAAPAAGGRRGGRGGRGAMVPDSFTITVVGK